MDRDPDDPIVSFFARLKTGEGLDLLNMGVGSVPSQGQEIEVETRKVFFLSRSIRTAEKSKNYGSGPISSLKLELSIVSNSERLFFQTPRKNCLNRYLISERPNRSA